METRALGAPVEVAYLLLSVHFSQLSLHCLLTCSAHVLLLLVFLCNLGCCIVYMAVLHVLVRSPKYLLINRNV